MVSFEKQPLAQHAHMIVSFSDGSNRYAHAIRAFLLFQNQFSDLPFSSSKLGIEFKALLMWCDLYTTEV